MNSDYIVKRIKQLRLQKGVAEFLAICDYLKVIYK
jgi:hypothetical protein